MELHRIDSATLIIRHLTSTSSPTFELTRITDSKTIKPVALISPYEFAVTDRPDSNLMKELRWYLERFLDYPFSPETDHSEYVRAALKAWGTYAFTALFDRRDASEWLAGSKTIQIRSDDPNVLSWPWEALFDPQTQSYFAHERQIERRLNHLGDPRPLVNLPRDRINILLVVARPYEGDVRYRSLARPLVELIRRYDLPANVDILRPPTFSQLRDHLRTRPNFYHLLHFDGHGAYGQNAGPNYALHLQPAQGYLVFENDKGEADPKAAEDLSVLLREHAVPAVVLNACQSATLDDRAEDAFATVATAFLQSGVRSVVAMAYSLYVKGAQVFLPAFYRRLFELGNIAEAVRAGRQQMLADKLRFSGRGPFPLDDWILPVLYQQDPITFAFAHAATAQPIVSHLPNDIKEHRDLYDFIGRDGPILQMERALHRQVPCILISGIGGVGKTTLARGFLRWLDETGGLAGAQWFDFREIRTAEHVINRIGEAYCSQHFSATDNKLRLLNDAFKHRQILIVWDNFESATDNLTNEDRAELIRFLDAMRGTRSKVIVTSRSTEEWLEPARRFQVKLNGLDREERWEYADLILRELGLKVNRDDPALTKLINLLDGHPLAMRVVLPALEYLEAEHIAGALENNINNLKLSDNEEQQRLFATLAFVDRELAPDLLPLLNFFALHETHIHPLALEEMARPAIPDFNPSSIDRILEALRNAGLIRNIGSNLHEVHPLLTTYLRSRTSIPVVYRRSFVTTMANAARSVRNAPYHAQQKPFSWHGGNFHAARRIAAQLTLSQEFAILTELIGAYALTSFDLVTASRMFTQLLEHAVGNNVAYWEASAHYNLGRISQETRDFETARDHFAKSLLICQRSNDINGIVAAYNQLGIVAEHQRNLESATNWHLKAIAIREEKKDLPGIAGSYHQLGRIAEEQGDFKKAREWYLKSINISEAHNIVECMRSTYHQLGTVLLEMDEPDDVRQWYEKSLTISEKYSLLNDAAKTYHQLGRVAHGQRQFDTAGEYFAKSLAISEKRAEFGAACSTYHQLGMLAVDQGALGAARDWYLKALAIKEKFKDLNDAASTYYQLGMLALEQHDYNSAYDWYFKSLSVWEKNDNARGCIAAYIEMGVLTLRKGAVEESVTWLVRAIRRSREAKIRGLTDMAVEHFVYLNTQVSAEDKQMIKAIWHENDLGPFPEGLA